MKKLLLMALIALALSCSKETNNPASICKTCTEETVSTTNGTITRAKNVFKACGDQLTAVDGATSTTQYGGYSLQYGNQPITTAHKTTICQ